MSAPVCTIVPQYNSAGVQIGECVSCPEVPAIIGRPGYTITDPQYGWNASALSVERRAGDCFTEFSVLPSVGCAVGFTNERISNDPSALSHAFLCYRSGGREYWVVSEFGVVKTSAVLRAPDTDLFRIERRAGVVRYFFNKKQIYQSSLMSYGELIVVAAMYAAGDGVN